MNVLVTGSSGGLGRAIVKKFAVDGNHIWAHMRTSNPEYEEELQFLARATGSSITPIYFDMTDTEMMKAEMKQVFKSDFGVDVLVNNAGVLHSGLFQMTSIGEMRKVFDVNYFAVLELTQLVVRFMTRKKKGVIVNVVSVAGEDVTVGNCAYGTSKAALIAMTKLLAKELAEQGIRVNGVAPGLSDTRMAASMSEEGRQNFIDASAMKRLAEPEEIANVVSFLASDEASFVNGQILRVDGGLLLS